MASLCTPNVTATGLKEGDAENLLLRMKNLAQVRSEKSGQPVADALRHIAGEVLAEDKVMTKVSQRNALLSIKARRDVKNYVGKFLDKGRTAGEGLLAYLQGAMRVIGEARNSVDYKIQDTHRRYFGRLTVELERAGVLSDFIHAKPELIRDVYRELGELKPGVTPKSTTGNAAAYKIARIWDGVNQDIVTRMNLAGAFIHRMPGFIASQTHDMMAIRALGGVGNSALSKEKSYQAWSKFVKPLLDNEKTFEGRDVEKTLRDIHGSLYAGLHGGETHEATVYGSNVSGSLSGKVSQARLLHFQDADAAFKYNQTFGVRRLKEQILQELHNKSRVIGLLENLGPNPEQDFKQVIRELSEEARNSDDAARQMDSLKDWRLMAAFHEVTGENERTVNPRLSENVGIVKLVAQLAKMGSVTLSSFNDRAFAHLGLTHNAMGHLEAFTKQLLSLAPLSTDEKMTLRLQRVGMESLMGSSMSRFTSHSNKFGWAHDLQKSFFNLNFLNQWTDFSKRGIGRILAANLGEHSHLPFEKMPPDLQRNLGLYGITPARWDALREHVSETGGQKFLFSHEVESNISDASLKKLVEEKGLSGTRANLDRERNLIGQNLGVYYLDQIDQSIPTPGAAEKKYFNFDTKAGTPLGEAVRLVMMFKSFPITVMRKIVGREIYGHGANTVGEWLMNDHRGKWNMATLIALTTAVGYVTGALRDALKGRTPKSLVDDSGNVVWKTINDAALRGGALGMMGDMLMSEYDANYRGFLQTMAGPIAGQLDTVMDLKTGLQKGANVSHDAGKLLLDNTPYVSLFYVRPVLDYLALWQLQEMMSPGSMRRMEKSVEKNYHQEFFVRPSEHVNK